MPDVIRMRRVATRVAFIALVVSFIAPSPLTIAARQSASATCRPSGPLVQVPGLREASGLAVSRRVPGRLWTHNDSGQPIVFALDARGSVLGQVRLTGARVEDWEAIAVGPCAAGSCLYVGDIGDNEAERRRITIYRLPEPADPSGTVAVADVFHATYPDGPHDAEALLVDGAGIMHVVTKGETGPIGVYRFPSQLQSGGTARLERVGPTPAKAKAASWITDAAVSPDGQRAVVRTLSSLTFYRAADLLSGQWRDGTKVDLSMLQEPQGEGVAWGPDNLVFLAGEGKRQSKAGTFARLTCAPGVS